MFRLLAVAALLALASAGGPAQASDTDTPALVRALFGKAPGKGKTSVCFTRGYTPAHLASHPRQNVREMVLLLTSTRDPDVNAVYSTRVGVHFRKAAAPFETGGGCGIGGDGKTISCGVDCDGGSIGVEARDARTIYVRIPDGARLWQPGKDDEDSPSRKRFGSDDKIFKLTRAAGARQCMSALGKE